MKKWIGWRWGILGATLSLAVVLSTGWCRAEDLNVDGGNTYTINSNSTFNNANIGILSTGAVSQSSFTTTLTGFLSLGCSPGSSGTYSLNGGDLYTGGESIGLSGNGVFNQGSGNHAVDGQLNIGNNSGSSGVYNLIGGSNTSTILEIGCRQGSSGTYNQSGGTSSISAFSYLGYSTGGSGAYNLSGGSLSQLRLYVGLHGSGVFSQSGGSNTVRQGDIYAGLYLGYWGDASGAYNLSNGSLTAPFESIGVFGRGFFNQSNGANKTGDLSLADWHNTVGTYSLSGGTLSVDNEAIGYLGNGSFLQTGGVHTVAHDLVLAAKLGSTANLTFLGGSLSVGGNYLQNAPGMLTLGIASASNYPVVNISGKASLNGSLTPILLGGFRPQANQIYSILTAGGGISGEFTLTNPQIGPTLYWQPRYTADRLDLLVARDYHQPGLGLNPNQAAVGAVLNGLAGAATGDLDTVLNAVDNLPTAGAVQDAFKQISPEKAGALATLGFASATFQMRNLATRTTNLRFGALGNSGPDRANSGRLALNYSRDEGIMLAYNGSNLVNLFRGRQEFSAPESRWGLFADGGAAFGSQKSTANQTGFGFSLAGFTAGGDYRVADHLLLGLATGYSHTGSGFRGSGGGITADTLPFNAYAAYLPGSFYAYGSLGYALNLFELERGLNFGGLSRTAKSATSGHQFNAYGETGYDLKVWRYILTPTATLAYSRLWVGGFTEQDAGALSLRVGSQTADSLQTGVGGRLTLPLKVDQVQVIPQAYAFYQHEFANGSRGLNASLSQAGSTFSFQTDAAQRNFAVVGACLTLGLKENLRAQVNYNAEVGRGNYTSHFINAGLRYEF